LTIPGLERRLLSRPARSQKRGCVLWATLGFFQGQGKGVGLIKFAYKLAFKLFQTIFADIVPEYPGYQVSFSVTIFYVWIFGI
jgi:hypothetical protein